MTNIYAWQKRLYCLINILYRLESPNGIWFHFILTWHKAYHFHPLVEKVVKLFEKVFNELIKKFFPTLKFFKQSYVKSFSSESSRFTRCFLKIKINVQVKQIIYTFVCNYKSFRHYRENSEYAAGFEFARNLFKSFIIGKDFLSISLILCLN